MKIKSYYQSRHARLAFSYGNEGEREREGESGERENDRVTALLVRLVSLFPLPDHVYHIGAMFITRNVRCSRMSRRLKHHDSPTIACMLRRLSHFISDVRFTSKEIFPCNALFLTARMAFNGFWTFPIGIKETELIILYILSSKYRKNLFTRDWFKYFDVPESLLYNLWNLFFCLFSRIFILNKQCFFFF